jgi:hypothetical protein
LVAIRKKAKALGGIQGPYLCLENDDSTRSRIENLLIKS